MSKQHNFSLVETELGMEWVCESCGYPKEETGPTCRPEPEYVATRGFMQRQMEEWSE